jgi:hypothetical protein
MSKINIYAANPESYQSMKDVTEDFKVQGLHTPKVPGSVEVELLHMPCLSLIFTTLHVDEEFTCYKCSKHYQIASIHPFKIVEVRK